MSAIPFRLRDVGASLIARAGRLPLRWFEPLGALVRLWARAVRSVPEIHWPELMHGLVKFGYHSIPLTIGMAALAGATVIAQTSLYVRRFGARNYLGWAAGYSAIWELGPLLLAVMMIARVGSRNAAELATIKINGQWEGLRGVALDPYPLIVAPRLISILLSVTGLAALTFPVAVLSEMIVSFFTLQVPLRVFLQSFASLLTLNDLIGGLCKSFVFGGLIASISTMHGLRASGGARAVGRAAATAVVWSAAAIFASDLILTALLTRVLK